MDLLVSDAVTDVAVWVALIRDVVLLLLLLTALLAALVLFRKVTALLSSASRTVKSVEELTATVSDRLVKPATAGKGVASGAGKVGGFIFRILRRNKGGERDGG